MRITSLPQGQRFCRLLRHTLREAPHLLPESTLIAACGWRALTARMALPLSAMATKHHSCSGEPPPRFGSTVTIFHPVVMAEGYPSPFVPPESQHATAQLSLPYRACQGDANGAWVELKCFKFVTRIGVWSGRSRNPGGVAPAAQVWFFILSRSALTAFLRLGQVKVSNGSSAKAIPRALPRRTTTPAPPAKRAIS